MSFVPRGSHHTALGVQSCRPYLKPQGIASGRASIIIKYYKQYKRSTLRLEDEQSLVFVSIISKFSFVHATTATQL